MMLREPGCRACSRSTALDCGGHGPSIILSERFIFGTPERIATMPTTVVVHRIDVNAPTAHIRAEEAALCGNCDSVFFLKRGECPGCASRQWTPLTSLMRAR